MALKLIVGLAFLLQSFWLSLAAPLASPTVVLDNGTFIGTTSDGVTRFLGIPFAKPPLGDLRYRLPEAIPAYHGTFDATQYGPSCIQQAIRLPIVTGLAKEATDWIVNSIFSTVFPDSEDCLTVNVVKPKTATSSSKLPVVVWIFGGGFELGSTSMYDGGAIVSRSLDLNQPVVFVSMNYRLTGLGFLAGKEVKEAGVGNLGLHDQRQALRWVQKYITQFGGDPSKVTIWGESAGAISASLHMLANGGNTEGLFRGAFMQSGAPIPVGDITNGQKYYDALVSDTGCRGASDTLQCLRTVPYSTLKAAINKSPGIFDYQSLSLAWLPRVDGVFLTDSPPKLVEQGKFANIPYVTGNCDDEGTLFALSLLNITTDQQFKKYFKNTLVTSISDVDANAVAAAYPSDPSQGSPFGTGPLYAISPQFKRLAAVLGDAVFHAPRRWFLQHSASNQDTWVFVSRRFKLLPVLGSTHASDLANSWFLAQEMQDHLIRFTSKLNPNPPTGFQWPKYDLSAKKVLAYVDDLLFPLQLDTDNWREAGINTMNDLFLRNPL